MEKNADFYSLEIKINRMIDELQGLCSQNGLSNTAGEEVVVTSTFLYKFLNDKYMYNLKKWASDLNETVEEVLKNKNSELDAFYDAHPTDVVFHEKDTIEYLINSTGKADFCTLLDDTLERISGYPENDKFKVETSGGEKQPLFNRITENVVDSRKRNDFAVALFGIISEDKFDFSSAFGQKFDFYSTIFEYLIKNYNVASGTYAEYFTPQAVSSIIAKILVGMSEIDDNKLYDVLDCAAGSGSLVLHLANELGHGNFGNRARVYCQDVSTKSTRFLRLNLMLNGLTESLDNIVQGDSLLNPSQYVEKHNPSSGYKKFDFIVINPPFKLDFSKSRDIIEHNWQDTDRFFAGLPKIPKNEDGKKKMAIYLPFIQHVLWSLKKNGRAAIVCPTGFLTAQSGIEFKIREKLIENNWLKGVISMPSNIFANTGTSVSVLFIDKTKEEDNSVMFIDASDLGDKRKEGTNQRTVLNESEINKIIDSFINKVEDNGFSVITTNEEIAKKKYSFSAGLYFDIVIKHPTYTNDEFEKIKKNHLEKIKELDKENLRLSEEISSMLEEISYE